jgi:cytochrome oxidase Cu insertion factor (SCO1/SenC/PrrC family)
MNPERRHLLTGACAFAGTAALGHSSAVLAQSSSAPAAGPSPAAMEAKAPPMPAPGSLIKLPEVPLFDGTVFRPAQAEGQVLVIYWWASDCPFCAQQSPEMQKLWQSQREKGPKGLQMLTLSVDRKREDALNYLKKKAYTFPAGFVTPDIQRVLPKPRGLPITLVRGRDGKLLQGEKGQLFPEDVELLAQWL